MLSIKNFVRGALIGVAALTSTFSWSQANATPITVSYDDSVYSIRSYAFTGRPIFVGTLDQQWMAVMSLPRFDPALGTLLSVTVKAGVHLQGQLGAHCQFVGYCDASASAGVSDTLNLALTSSELGVDLGANLSVSTSLSVACSDTAFSAACSNSQIRTPSDTRDLTFTGADLAGFYGTDPFNFYDFISPGSKASVSLSMSQSGFPTDAVLEAYADDGGDISALAYILNLALKATSNDPMHAGAYSHAHVLGLSTILVSVDYTYEPGLPPTAGVPEPAALGFLMTGLAGLGVARRSRRKNAA